MKKLNENDRKIEAYRTPKGVPLMSNRCYSSLFCALYWTRNFELTFAVGNLNHNHRD